jgi:hypothetical protein
MTSPKKTVNRRDATGHLDPEYQRKLLDASGKSSRDDEPRAFIDGAATEELSEELGEAFVQAATTGEDAELERRESVSAGGTDESNIPEATREALPTTSKAPV